MNILISNDDGYLAPGIQVLAKRLADIGKVTVIAPDRNRSGASNSLTLMQPLNVNRVSEGVFAIEGTPVDCVLVALGGLMKETPDIVVSGINDGPNLGCDTLYSGTVAAAMEARFLDYSSIAVSMARHSPKHFETAAEAVVRLIAGLEKKSPAERTVLNVNVPDIPFEKVKGFQATRLGNRHAPVPASLHDNPRGAEMYWLGAAGAVNDKSPGTDFHAVMDDYISVTPLQTDLTNQSLISPLQQWCGDITSGKNS